MTAKEKKLYTALRDFHEVDGKLRRAIIALNKTGDIETEVALEMFELMEDDDSRAKTVNSIPKAKLRSKLRDESDDFAGACGMVRKSTRDRDTSYC